MAATDFEQGLVARYQLDDAEREPLRSPDFDGSKPLGYQENHRLQMEASHPGDTELDFSAMLKNCKSIDINSVEIKQQIDFMKIQAQVRKTRKG